MPWWNVLFIVWLAGASLFTTFTIIEHASSVLADRKDLKEIKRQEEADYKVRREFLDDCITSTSFDVEGVKEVLNELQGQMETVNRKLLLLSKTKCENCQWKVGVK